MDDFIDFAVAINKWQYDLFLLSTAPLGDCAL
jgi:hypothetical protein